MPDPVDLNARTEGVFFIPRKRKRPNPPASNGPSSISAPASSSSSLGGIVDDVKDGAKLRRRDYERSWSRCLGRINVSGSSWRRERGLLVWFLAWNLLEKFAKVEADTSSSLVSHVGSPREALLQDPGLAYELHRKHPGRRFGFVLPYDSDSSPHL
jgi:hypothetical protein